ncbi:deleted in malignant brain tumors 1 protein [Strongylocentrotus purpuratus]|uniref:SRCR domain-containing protein n=1 Tax=Strongylocentrotus purpuratus TaxID=7668 RepID=A0A7M7SXZ2_STRPU|nr:deleted in malignant brain tumors 1 protein [Strongylocentrotus purpuratus]
MVRRGLSTEDGELRVRLVDGASSNEGRVEVNYQGSWCTICDDSWDIKDATVVCRMLGYPGVSSALVRFGEGTGNTTLGNVECDGSETHIAHCNNGGYEIHNCPHSEDVGVICSGEVELKVRLVGGPDESEGRVELFYFGSWGTVCSYDWTSYDSEVVCRMLGFIGAIAHSAELSYGNGTGDVILRQPRCSGKESSLVECDPWYNLGNTDCRHTSDFGVSCLKVDDLQVRLVSGRSDKEGRVEILYLGTWGTVCDDNWDIKDANVVCRMLGYERAENFSCCAAFGLGSGPIVLDEVECEVMPIVYPLFDLTEVDQEGSKTGQSQAAIHGLIGFLSVAVIGFILACIIMTVFMMKYRRSANEARSQQQERYPRTGDQNCYNGSQPREEECLQLNVVPAKLPEGSWDQDEVYDTPRHADDEDVYENIQI